MIGKPKKLVQKVKEVLGLQEGPLFGYYRNAKLVGYEFHCPAIHKSCRYDCPNFGKPCNEHDRICKTTRLIDGLMPRGPFRCAQCNKEFDIVAIATPAIHEERLRKARTEEGKEVLLKKPVTVEEIRYFTSQLPKAGNSEIPFLEDDNWPPGISRKDGPHVVFDGVVGMVYEPADPERAGDPGNHALGDPAK